MAAAIGMMQPASQPQWNPGAKGASVSHLKPRTNSQATPAKEGQSVLAAVEAENEELHRQLAGAESEVRSWRTKYGKLKERKQEEAEQDPLWPLCTRIFKYHARVFHHEQADWTGERFFMLKRRIKNEQGAERALRAISGLLSDAWRVEHKQTTFEHVFESPKAFEAALAKCPKDWTPPKGYEG